MPDVNAERGGRHGVSVIDMTEASSHPDTW